MQQGCGGDPVSGRREFPPSALVYAARKLLADIDILRVQELGLTGADDAELLEWAAHRDRVILTQHANTLIAGAYERVTSGVLELVKPFVPRDVAFDIAMCAYCGTPEDFQHLVRFLPIR